MKILVLGAGLVGAPMALDLARGGDMEVTAADIDPNALARLADRQAALTEGSLQQTGVREYPKAIRTVQADLSDPREVTRLAGAADMVINAVPGFMGFQTLKTVIGAGKDIVDISFFIEDPFELDQLAREKNVTAIMDMGVAPGMCNVLIGYAHHLFDRTDSVLYMVGGLPVVRQWPWEYRAVFSPVDVIEEYTRPARLVEKGEVVVRPALSDPELIDFPGIGTLEAFNTDGLRSLIKTIDCPEMREKTLRYPGHIEKMRILRDTGYFSGEKIDVGGVKVSPMEMTARLLFPKWKLGDDEADLTVMKVEATGIREGRPARMSWYLHDTRDAATGVHSMARTTGYAATVALRMVASGLYTRKGISVPEYIGRHPECVEYMLDGLKERGVVYRQEVGG